ncbi:MAG TPA: hypothetical protein VEU96_14630 [Bryobacteraceae bacterium]|nr:hypothetical protein [Bryobacteraceae bacterium]
MRFPTAGVSVVLFVAAALLAIFFGITILNLHGSDAAGNAYAIAWATAEFLLWTLLGILFAGAAEFAAVRMMDYRATHGCDFGGRALFEELAWRWKATPRSAAFQGR